MKDSSVKLDSNEKKDSSVKMDSNGKIAGIVRKDTTVKEDSNAKKLHSRNIFYGIQAKIFLFLTLAIGALFLVTFLAVEHIVRTERFNSLTKQNDYYNEKMLSAFEETREELNQLTANFILNEYVQKSLTSQVFTTYDREMMEKSLSYQSKSYLDYYMVIDNKGRQYSKGSVELDMTEFYQSEIFQCLGDDYSKTKLIWAKDTVFGTDEMSFFAVRYIRELNSVHEPGILILKLNDAILDGVRESITDERLVYLVLNANDEICFGQMPYGQEWNEVEESSCQTVWKEVKNRIENIDEQKLKDGILSKRVDENTGFTLLTYAPTEVSLGVIKQIEMVLAAIFGITYAVGLIFTIFYARYFTRPIKYLSETMSGFDENHLEQQIHLSTNTELDQIGNAYNSMVERVGILMTDVQTKERELRKSELQSLMYQIRPHFLYNTLDTIYMLARISKEETIMKMIQSLSRFLRINLSNGNEEIPVEKELEHVGAYLEIQKIRNADLFEYEISCEETIAALPIMKTILQPVAENCIKYGFRDIYDGGKIKISACTVDRDVCLSVANNGAPMDDAAMEQLNSFEKMSMEEMDKVVQNRQGGYGISNVVRRLRMRYSDKVRFYYVMEDGWTVCKIHIALECIREMSEEESK